MGLRASHTHLHIYHAVENVGGHKQRRCDEGYKFGCGILYIIMFEPHFMYMCVISERRKHIMKQTKMAEIK